MLRSTAWTGIVVIGALAGALGCNKEEHAVQPAAAPPASALPAAPAAPAAPPTAAPLPAAPVVPSGVDVPADPAPAAEAPPAAAPSQVKPEPVATAETSKPAKGASSAKTEQAKPEAPKQGIAVGEPNPSAVKPEKPVAPAPEPAPPPPAPPPAPAPAATPAAKTGVTVPKTDNVQVIVPKGMQALLDADTRMQPWVNKVVAVGDRCYNSKGNKATATIVVEVTMHKDARPDADIKSLPPELAGVVACSTGDLMRTKMPLFSGPEGQRHTLKIKFTP